MKSAFIKQNDGYGYNTSMLPNYDGFIIIKPGFLKHTDEIICVFLFNSSALNTRLHGDTLQEVFLST